MDSNHEDFQPASQSELCRFVRDNAQSSRQALQPVGGRTALQFGHPMTTGGIQIATTSLNRVVDYPARDMTITVEAGIRMDELAETLRVERQQLPIDVSQSNRATLGGAIATNTSGPRRFGYGTFRDYVIGISGADAQGRLFKAGGRVVKNVAGYDLCKLLVGSLGTLAIITQVTLKVKPIPESSAILCAGFSSFTDLDSALETLTATAARPVVIDVLNARAARHIAGEARCELPSDVPILLVGVEGTKNETAWQLESLQSELTAVSPTPVATVRDDDRKRLLGALTEFPVSSEEPLTFRASLRPSLITDFLQAADAAGMSVQAHAGNGIVCGHLPDDASSSAVAAQMLAPLQQIAEDCRGNMTVLHCEDAWKCDLPQFGSPSPSWKLMQRVKDGLDPHHLLNPGRLFASTATQPS